ncbi:ABC transporter ATP-binding protein [Leifsonia sp. PS1209]|uniref:dipeptide ABC transporter ATP-binding protein n=1 Tax=Leifsonia sp. PS1209 TaxID=2724914 RepID=UPI001442C6D0|nr:ABC transporter ATP-binding protein [Leifsonia sp. PS1209]QJA00229.1 ABC transporter ATP-binding protein [Leifsonia sp. PS1209]
MTTQHDGVILDVQNLSIAYDTDDGQFLAVDDVSFTIGRGETFGLAGESGSGKSTIANAILGLLAGGRVTSGRILFEGTDVSTLTGENLRNFRWKSVSMVFQSAMNALNPVMTIGDQIVDVFTTHTDLSRSQAKAKARELLTLVGIDQSRISAYPHQLSGGMRQRAVIATALALNPALLIMDEPTTALDVVVQQEIIQEIQDLQAKLGFAILFITHDLSLMVEVTKNLGVMRTGRLLEIGPSRTVYRDPQHPYTQQLIAAFPPVSRGTAEHNPARRPESGDDRDVVISVRGLSKSFHQGGLFSRSENVAVNDVNFDLHTGEILALVGESGSGKSTVARMLARLESPSAGSILLDGTDILQSEPKRASRRYRGAVQMVFQDPFGSLNPSHRIRHFLERAVLIHSGRKPRKDMDAVLADLMTSVELDPAFLDRYPHELSGGQRQRVSLARALAAEPQVILADEPTSMLDVSVRMGVLQLMKKLRDERGISILYITHDLASARFIADTTIVMLRGSFVEGGASGVVMDNPIHPYTQLLVSAAPDPERTTRYEKDERAQTRATIAELIANRTPTAWVKAVKTSPDLDRTRISADHWVATSDLPATQTTSGATT